MYIKNTGIILTAMGYISGVDFFLKIDGQDNVILDWMHIVPKPTEQDIIDNELMAVKSIQIERVKQASAEKRLKYVTQAAGKDAEYTFKAQEAAQFDIDGSVGVFMQSRINNTGETAAAIATEWNAKATAWKSVGGAIAALEDKANIDINAETVSANCQVIADGIIASIEAI